MSLVSNTALQDILKSIKIGKEMFDATSTLFICWIASWPVSDCG
jgi:hypothetical protein